jgi:hypothetical protein
MPYVDRRRPPFRETSGNDINSRILAEKILDSLIQAPAVDTSSYSEKCISPYNFGPRTYTLTHVDIKVAEEVTKNIDLNGEMTRQSSRILGEAILKIASSATIRRPKNNEEFRAGIPEDVQLAKTTNSTSGEQQLFFRFTDCFHRAQLQGFLKENKTAICAALKDLAHTQTTQNSHADKGQGRQ